MKGLNGQWFHAMYDCAIVEYVQVDGEDDAPKGQYVYAGMNAAALGYYGGSLGTQNTCFGFW